MDDRTIACLLGRGSPDALAALSDRYRERLVGYAARLLADPVEAEDVVQEVILRAGQANGPRSEASLAGWLYAVCYRLAVDRMRSRERRARLHSRAASRAGPQIPVEARAELWDELRRVEAVLHDLPDPYRTAVTLRYLEGREFREIARIMGAVERTARTWVGRGLTRLRRRLGGPP